MKIQCEYDLCIYYKNGNCILDKISIDELGMCAQCINVTIPENIIKKYKRKQLAVLE